MQKAVAGTQEPERQLKNSDGPEPGQAASIAASQPAEAPKSEVKSEVTPEVKSEAKSEVKPEVALPPPATLEIAATPAASEIAAAPVTAAAAPALAPRTIQQQVVEATGMADLVTAIGTGREAANKSDNPGTEAGEASDTGKTASGSTDSSDNLVALVLARPEINSLSDLNNKSIAIEEKQSAASGSVSAALMAAGAAEIQFSEVQTGAIDRLINGEVPAVVLTLASPEAAEWFPDIKGFKTFRVPLSLKARLAAGSKRSPLAQHIRDRSTQRRISRSLSSLCERNCARHRRAFARPVSAGYLPSPRFRSVSRKWLATISALTASRASLPWQPQRA